jgi:hypothetical protein
MRGLTSGHPVKCVVERRRVARVDDLHRGHLASIGRLVIPKNWPGRRSLPRSLDRRLRRPPGLHAQPPISEQPPPLPPSPTVPSPSPIHRRRDQPPHRAGQARPVRSRRRDCRPRYRPVAGNSAVGHHRIRRHGRRTRQHHPNHLHHISRTRRNASRRHQRNRDPWLPRLPRRTTTHRSHRRTHQPHHRSQHRRDTARHRHRIILSTHTEARPSASNHPKSQAMWAAGVRAAWAVLRSLSERRSRRFPTPPSCVPATL